MLKILSHVVFCSASIFSYNFSKNGCSSSERLQMFQFDREIFPNLRSSCPLVQPSIIESYILEERVHNL